MLLLTKEDIHSKEMKTGTMEKRCYLANRPSYMQSLFYTQARTSICLGKCVVHSGLGTSTSNNNQQNSTETCPQANLTWENPQLRLKAMSSWRIKLSGTGFSCPASSLFHNCMQVLGPSCWWSHKAFHFLCFSKPTQLHLSFLLIL